MKNLLAKAIGILAILVSFYISGFSMSGFVKAELAPSGSSIVWTGLIGFSALFVFVFIGLVISNITGRTDFMMRFFDSARRKFEGLLKGYTLKALYIMAAGLFSIALGILLVLFGINDNTPLLFIGTLLLLYGTEPKYFTNIVESKWD